VGRPQLALLGLLLALPLAALAVLLAAPDADVHWQHQPSHFWLVLVTAGLNAVLAYATGVAARRRDDRRVHLVSLSFLAASGFLALHALATPGVLLETSNLGFVVATPIGLVLAGALAALSALERAPIHPRALERGLLVLLAAWAVVSLTLFPEVDDTVVPERLSAPLVALSVAGVALYAFAVLRYVTLWRERRSRLVLGFALAFVLLAEAMVAVALGRNWQASWWEWHVLMLLAFGLIAAMAHAEGPEERWGRLYRVRDARSVTVLFADLQGFTSYSEREEPAAVAQTLDAFFAVAIPALERHDGRVDRLVGDAIFATFEGERHAERAARAALELQSETGALAAEHPGWPRFRVGLNSGDASVGVLGTGTGRTYSAIGDAVNLGSRIEGLAPAGGVALSADTAAQLWGARTRPLGTVAVKGREEPVEVLLLESVPPG
jgi:adenylate cyclase